jgi:hypothetical protein
MEIFSQGKAVVTFLLQNSPLTEQKSSTSSFKDMLHKKLPTRSTTASCNIISKLQSNTMLVKERKRQIHYFYTVIQQLQ